MILKLTVVLALILVNGLFAMGEMAIVSARKARLDRLAKLGHKGARRALRLSEHPTDMLSTVQIGITLVGVLTGAVGGVTLSDDLAVWLADIPMLAGYSDDLAFLIVVVGLSYISLILGELVPKRLALAHPERISSALAGFMGFMSTAARPAIWFLSRSTELVLKLIPVRASDEAPVTDEEIRTLMRQGAEAGAFHEAEQAIVDMTLKLGDRRVSALMTPRTQIEFLDVQEPWLANLERIKASPRSRFPVIDGDVAHILGVIQVKDMLADSLSGQAIDLRAYVRPPVFVPETAMALKVLEQFKQTGAAMALIVDEYGDLQGLVTLNDMLEALVGDIAEEEGEDQPSWVKRADGSFLIDGMMPLDEVRDIIGAEALPGADDSTIQTLGGYMMALMKRVPAAGDVVENQGFRFEIMDMDGRRVDKVLVVLPPDSEPVEG